MKNRLFSLLLVVMLVLATVPTVFAQGGDDMLCLNLSEADCAIVMEAMANNENITSFAMEYAVNLGLSGLQAAAMMMGGGGTEDIGDVMIDIAGTGTFVEVMDAMPPASLEMSLTYSLDDGMEAESGAFDLIVVDGILYGSEDGGVTWEGITFDELLADDPTGGMLSGMMGGDLSELPAGSLSPDDLAADPFAMLEEFGLSEADVAALSNVEGVVTKQRLADEEVMGQTMYVFETVTDLGPLFASPEFNNLMSSMMETAAAEDPDAAMMAGLIPMLLMGLDIQIVQTEYIGASDMFTHGMALDVAAALDLGALMGAAGGESSMQIPPIALNLSFEVMLDQINQTFDIAAPAGATMSGTK